MPHFNHGPFVEEAIKSIAPQVDALVVVDDGSQPFHRDAARQSSADAGCAFLALPENQGQQKAINEGVRRLRRLDIGEDDWLTWVSADNTYRPNWRDTLLGAADENTGAVYTAFNWYRGAPRQGQKKFQPYAPDRLINQPNRCFFGPSFLIRASVWKEAGPHRGRNAHDYDHWLRVEEVCWKRGLDIVGVSTVTCDFRAHPERASEYRNNKHWWDQHKWQQEAIKRRSENPSS